jgi:hypothetical protein
MLQKSCLNQNEITSQENEVPKLMHHYLNICSCRNDSKNDQKKCRRCLLWYQCECN